MEATIVLDLDDTLVSSAFRQLECVLQSIDPEGLKSREEHLTRFQKECDCHWLAFSGMTASQLQACFLEHKLLERSEWDKPYIFQAWLDAIAEWRSVGHKVIICTARAWHPDARQLTMQLLGPIAQMVSLIIVPHDHHASKVERLRVGGYSPAIFVDDNPKEIDSAQNAIEPPPIVIWNKHSCVTPPRTQPDFMVVGSQFVPEDLIDKINLSLALLKKSRSYFAR